MTMTRRSNKRRTDRSPHPRLSLLRRQLGLSWVVLLLSLCYRLAQAGQDSIPILRRSLSAVDEDEPERVAMGPFSVKLAPTPLPLEGAALDSLYVYIQETLVDFMKGQAQSGLTVRYFVMTDIGVQETEGNVSTLRIATLGAILYTPGIPASFTSTRVL